MREYFKNNLNSLKACKKKTIHINIIIDVFQTIIDDPDTKPIIDFVANHIQSPQANLARESESLWTYYYYFFFTNIRRTIQEAILV